MRDSNPQWQKLLATGFSSVSDLLTFLHLPQSLGSHLADKQFKVRLPRGFASLMEPGNPKDPLLMQVLPIAEELSQNPGFVLDPLQEKKANPLPGVIHKYQSRVLLTLTGSCAINCRYCFRRHFSYQENNPGTKGWEKVMQYIASDPSIQEVILSGGDPLLAKDTVLQALFSQLSVIAHVKTLRIHSRMPVVLPERIDQNFLQLLSSLPWQKVMVLHSNHPRELTESVKHACNQLKEAGVLLLNQSVLLKGVNDCAETLSALSHRLLSLSVLPYYLHLLDKVQGAGHFDVPLAKARAIYQQMQNQLPGYLLPRLAREEAGIRHKTLII